MCPIRATCLPVVRLSNFVVSAQKRDNVFSSHLKKKYCNYSKKIWVNFTNVPKNKIVTEAGKKIHTKQRHATGEPLQF
jgi:hypothetical protein